VERPPHFAVVVPLAFSFCCHPSAKREDLLLSLLLLLLLFFAFLFVIPEGDLLLSLLLPLPLLLLLLFGISVGLQPYEKKSPKGTGL
jgi:hypothetical protein